MAPGWVDTEMTSSTLSGEYREQVVASIPLHRIATPEDIDKAVRAWLHDQVSVGDVVYDVGAGVGLYAVLAARSRGATVIALAAYVTARRFVEQVIAPRGDA